MKKLNILLSTGLVFSALFTHAQNEVDALRYSRITFGGTARSSAMAGAFGALGADFSSLSTNPAGIALYRRNEITFTPSLYGSNTSSTYMGTTATDQKMNFNFGNAGLVATYTLDDETSEWKNINFGFGYNRLNNFHERFSITGENRSSSLTDQFLMNAEGVNPDDLNAFAEQLAFDTYILDIDTTDYSYFSRVPGNSIKSQYKAIERSGAMGEVDFSFGANYDEKLFLGATLAFQRIRFTEQSTYQEVDELDTIFDFKGFTFNEYLSTEGRGLNLKFGMILRPSDWLRIGGSVHTPTFFSMEDAYSASFSSRFDNGDKYESASPTGSFNYNLTTPLRAIGSLAFIIAKAGLISADYEFVDYSSATLTSSGFKFFDENTAIKNKYRGATNLRLGTEWRMDQFSFRGGYALYGNPFESFVNNSGSRTSYTGGIGFREDNYFIDVAYVYSTSKEGYYLYNPELVSAVSNRINSSSLMFTLGFRY